MTRYIAALAVAVAMMVGADRAHGFAYLFTSNSNPDIVAHPAGYTGAGGQVDISVGIRTDSAFASEMQVAVLNVIDVWNALEPTVNNLFQLENNDVPEDFVDYETILLHEMGHALGLHHPNLGSESGFSGVERNYTRANRGLNAVFDLDPGPDGVIGSADDIRGDDVNLNYFKTADNNPFSLPASDIIDTTTYSRDIALLPPGDSFSANPDRDVAASPPFNLDLTEAVVQQGAFIDEVQRTLGHDDVAGIRYAMSGVDGVQGTADDYTINLYYAGVTNSADIGIRMINTSSFASTLPSQGGISGTSDHRRVASATVTISTNFDWYFNQVRVPEPGAAALLALGALALTRRTRRRLIT